MIVDTAVKLLTDTLLNCTDGPFMVPSANMDNLSLVVTLLATITSLLTVALGILHLIYVSFYVTHRYRRAFIVYLAATAPVCFIYLRG
uniref:G-protein coupled receptors family 1 profile domain-containing protein n=1 Tax=Parascaris equorum TaxID=6256 RepID=A0A914S093_PAREQ